MGRGHPLRSRGSLGERRELPQWPSGVRVEPQPIWCIWNFGEWRNTSDGDKFDIFCHSTSHLVTFTINSLLLNIRLDAFYFSLLGYTVKTVVIFFHSAFLRGPRPSRPPSGYAYMISLLPCNWMLCLFTYNGNNINLLYCLKTVVIPVWFLISFRPQVVQPVIG